MRTTPAPSNKIDLTWPRNGLAGLIIAACVPPVIELYHAFEANPETPWLVASEVVYRWQTLLGSLFTPLAAVFTAWVVLSQIEANREQERERLRRRWRAQRAAMPSMMSRVCDYAERSAACLQQARRVARKDGAVSGARFAATYPQLDELTFERIIAMIEAASTEPEADAYHGLLHELQVHGSRWRGFTGTNGERGDRYVEDQIVEEFVDAAEIYARASNLLVQARPAGQAPGPAMTRKSAAFLLGVRDDADPIVKLAAAYDQRMALTYPSDSATVADSR